MLKYFVELPCCGCEWEYEGDLYRDGDTETQEFACWDCGKNVKLKYKLNISHTAEVLDD